MANNNYPQITSVTSEALQAQIRTLLPSQEGFGTDLMAQNVIVPVIDLTAAANASTIPQNMQTALSFGSQNAFDINNATTVIANNAGFWRIFAGWAVTQSSALRQNASLEMSDGLSTKTVWEIQCANSTSATPVAGNIDLVVFLNSGDSISGQATFDAHFIGSARQIADINGTLINPSGFNPQ